MVKEASHSAYDKQQIQFLIFHSGGQPYGMALAQITEIKQWQPVTQLPSTPPHIKGIINLRGQIIPVIDLAIKLGSQATDASDNSVCIIINSDELRLGLLVDEVDDILSLDESEIRKASVDDLPQAEAANLTSGFILSDEKPTVILNAELFFEKAIIELIKGHTQAPD